MRVKVTFPDNIDESGESSIIVNVDATSDKEAYEEANPSVDLVFLRARYTFKDGTQYTTNLRWEPEDDYDSYISKTSPISFEILDK